MHLYKHALHTNTHNNNKGNLYSAFPDLAEVSVCFKRERILHKVTGTQNIQNTHTETVQYVLANTQLKKKRKPPKERLKSSCSVFGSLLCYITSSN